MKKKIDPIFLFLVLTLLLFAGLSFSEGEAAPAPAPETGPITQAPPGADIRDIKGPMVPAGFPLKILFGLLGAGILAVSAGYTIRKRRKTRVFVSPSPEEKARAALDLLAEDLAAGMGPADASRFADILRRYLHDRFGLNALKLTTAETIPALKGLDGLAPDDLGLIAECLNEADAVKFARSFPLPGEMAARVRLCREMIARIAKRRAP